MNAAGSSWLRWAFLLALLLVSGVSCGGQGHHGGYGYGSGGEEGRPAPKEGGEGTGKEFEHDAKYLQVALNLEYLEAEFFSFSVFGYGLDKIDPSLVQGGPPPKGVQKAKLDNLTTDLIAQFAYQEVGHLRAIKQTLGKWYFSRPQLDVSKKVFAKILDKALEEKLEPPFNVYANPVNFFIGVYVIPYVGLTGYVGAVPHLLTPAFKRRVAGLLGVEAGQDAVTRQYLYHHKDEKLAPYSHTIAHVTARISRLRNNLSHAWEEYAWVDEGLAVAPYLSAGAGIVNSSEFRVGNILAGDNNSLSYARRPAQIFSTVYGTYDPSKPGGFYPKGAKGVIARSYLKGNCDDETLQT